MTRNDTHATRVDPRLDYPSLGVHALWAAWLVTTVVLWSGLPVPARVGAMVLGWAVMFWNYAVLHNHMHVPIAKARALKWIVSRTLGLACGFAYRGYYLHHFNHHRYNDGDGDWGRSRQGEGALRYCVRWALTPWLWPFDTVAKVWGACKTRGQKVELVIDFVVVDGTLLALTLWQPSLGLSLLGTLIVTQACIHYLNLAAHLGSDARERTRLAVTSTSSFYNRWFFNAGYHQAHHLKPQTPWRALPELTEGLEQQGQLPQELKSDVSPISPVWAAQVVSRVGSAAPEVTPGAST
ncbi:fatty acid desaturase [Pyxidicoccus parkwayensis]|uniref:Fatty acid desaturase n=1 Tax=Pyxidicoccus parkwayensis TaxID=2813578 RepID=A0ABX7NMP5_9BACT|nr:fatty acid desaturase [Pyxidicoccus parkwaysis]QSQ19923.1 fatty acid desaturase [Pyxidicoccus parkwaysis]